MNPYLENLTEEEIDNISTACFCLYGFEIEDYRNPDKIELEYMFEEEEIIEAPSIEEYIKIVPLLIEGGKGVKEGREPAYTIHGVKAGLY